MTERARKHRAIDAAGRGTGDNVDHHPQLGAQPNVAQELEIDRFGVVFRIGGIALVEECGLGALAAVGNRVQHTRCAHEFEDFLADAMHVHGERHAAEAHQRYA